MNYIHVKNKNKKQKILHCELCIVKLNDFKISRKKKVDFNKTWKKIILKLFITDYLCNFYSYIILYKHNVYNIIIVSKF